MSDNNNIVELREKYLRNELTSEELALYQEYLDENPEYAEEVNQDKKLIVALGEYQNTKSFKNQLNQYHKEIEVSELRKELQFDINYKPKRNRVLSYAAMVAIAASISIVSIFATLYKMGIFNYYQQIDHYSELEKRVNKISSNQKSIWNAFKSSETPEKAAWYSGTCFSISENGYMITNYHLIKNEDSVYIINQLDSLIKYKADVVFRDQAHDLAILKITDTLFTGFKNIPYNFMATDADLGEYVYTLGYSKNDIVFGEGSISSTTGFNSENKSYQVSIPANPGNSGGPLIDSKGNLIGIISGKHSSNENVTFAIKSDFVLAAIDSFSLDTLYDLPTVPQVNSLRKMSKTDQIKNLKPFIFQVRVLK